MTVMSWAHAHSCHIKIFHPVLYNQLEISELEEQRNQAAQQVKQLKESVDKLQAQIQYGGGGGRSKEMERR